MKKLLLLLAVFTTVPLFAQSSFELAYETSNYTYREPDGSLPISLKGKLQGGSARYENRFDGSPMYFAMDGRWMGGTTDYDGWLMNGDKYTADDIGDYYYEARFHMGRVADLSDQVQLWWAVGFGYRYLKDHMNKVDAGYLRESNYVYMPLTGHYRYNGGAWSLSLNGELDYLLFGWQQSHMNPTIRHDQHEGYGLRLSAKLQINLDGRKSGVFVEPYYRMWEIQDSEASGGYMEPHNKTEEVGIRAGITF